MEIVSSRTRPAHSQHDECTAHDAELRAKWSVLEGTNKLLSDANVKHAIVEKQNPSSCRSGTYL